MLGAGAGSRDPGHRDPHVATRRCGGVRPLASGADHTGVDLLGDAAHDAVAVGAAPGDPGAQGPPAAAADTGRPGRTRAGAHGRGQRCCQRGRVSARHHLVGLSSAQPGVAPVHRLVGTDLCARRDVVGDRSGSAAPSQSAVPGLHRVIRRHDPVDITDRGAARNIQLDSVRGARHDRGIVTGVSAGCGLGHHPGRRRRTGRTHVALDAGSRSVGDHADRRTGADGRRVLRWARLAAGSCGSDFPRCGRGATAQRAQARAGRPNTGGARTRSSAGPNPVARQRPSAGVGPRLRPSRER